MSIGEKVGDGRVVLLTGAGGGIGRAVAEVLLADGALVALCDRPGPSLAEAEADLTGRHGADRVRSLAVDVREGGSVKAAVEACVTAWGPLHGLATVAGVLRPAALGEITATDWREHFAVNTDGVLHALQHGTAAMRDGGAVVVVGSNAADVPRTRMAAYAASKAAAAALVRCAGLELAARGIRANVVEPGSTDTAMQRDLWPDPAAGARAAVGGAPDDFRVGIPLGRIAAPEDVAHAVAFLLSDRARHITLQRLRVDGGATL